MREGSSFSDRLRLRQRAQELAQSLASSWGAFGWSAARVTERAHLDAALATCLATPGPYFLDVAVAAEENCFPMIPAGAGHHEVMLGPQTAPMSAG